MERGENENEPFVRKRKVYSISDVPAFIKEETNRDDMVLESELKPEMLELVELSYAEAAYECPLCCASFAEERSLGEHVLVHAREERADGSKGLKCSMCDAQLSRDAALEEHVVIHMRQGHANLLTCPKCSALLPEHHLEHHLQFPHQPSLTASASSPNPNSSFSADETVFRCPKCPGTFFLHQHLVHVNERIYACPLCPANYNWKKNLSRHLQVRTARDIGA